MSIGIIPVSDFFSLVMYEATVEKNTGLFTGHIYGHTVLLSRRKGVVSS
jgi:hypothetical protein